MSWVVSDAVSVPLWFWALVVGLAVVGSLQIGYWIVTLLRGWLSPRTSARQRLLEAIAANDESYGFGLMRDLKLSAGHLYSLLEELEAEGIIESYQEPQPVDRPARTLYRLSRN